MDVEAEWARVVSARSAARISLAPALADPARVHQLLHKPREETILHGSGASANGSFA